MRVTDITQPTDGANRKYNYEIYNTLTGDPNDQNARLNIIDQREIERVRASQWSWQRLPADITSREFAADYLARRFNPAASEVNMTAYAPR